MTHDGDEMKCTFQGCHTYGSPQKGFDFFACEPCLEKLEELIRQKYAERHNKN